MEREMALKIVVSCVRDALEQTGTSGGEITEETVIVGPDAVIDSIGVVSLIVDIEQRVEMDHGVSITLASERAMSQRSSPFRNVGVLTDHVCTTIEEEGKAA